MFTNIKLLHFWDLKGLEEKVVFIIAPCVKEKFGNSYKDIPDDKFQEVVDYINFLKENPS